MLRGDGGIEFAGHPYDADGGHEDRQQQNGKNDSASQDMSRRLWCAGTYPRLRQNSNAAASHLSAIRSRSDYALAPWGRGLPQHFKMKNG
jgi:hypothetical protein